MNFYGLQKMTLIDYPGKISCVAFTHGCNFRCPFCHNPELVIEKPNPKEKISEEELLDFLSNRKGKLDGIVFTGGEPLIHAKELKSLIQKIKDLKYAIKLDTNGTNPEALKELIDENLIDYVAMDIKSSKEKYSVMGTNQNQFEDVLKSIEIIKDSKIETEFRTTVVPGIHDENELKKMKSLIKGAKKFTIQNFIPNGMINPEYSKLEPFPKDILEKFKQIVIDSAEIVDIRNEI